MTQNVELITKIAVSPDLWTTSMLPEGIIERWLFTDGSRVDAGDPVATVRIEDALHEVVAPARGRLSIGLKVNSVVEPGTGIGAIIRQVPNGEPLSESSV
ncbi:MAG TPA: lipoyl domain-containing protein [Rhizomicrobium sp.]|nr:lipoyl domain-containing protein [Rhizomicrobium sp.]